jgi:hypothetical protein
MSDWEGISFQLLSAATAVSKWGEPEQYEHLRSLMIGRFANSANPIVAEHIIKASLLEPASTETLNGLLPLADVIGKSLAAPDAEKDPHMVAWRQFSLALMAYRQGRLEDAAEWARRSIATASNSEERRDSNRLVLAMIAIREGRHADAEATLKQLRTKMDRWINAPFQINNPDGTLWYNQGTVVVLLEEAERMAREIPD